MVAHGLAMHANDDVLELVLRQLPPSDDSLVLLTNMLRTVSRGFRAAAQAVLADVPFWAPLSANREAFRRSIPELESSCNHRALLDGMRTHRSCAEVQIRAIEALLALCVHGDKLAPHITNKVVMCEMMRHGAFATFTSTMRAHPFENADYTKIAVQHSCVCIMNCIVCADEHFPRPYQQRTPEERARVVELARDGGVFDTVPRVLLVQKPGRGIVCHGTRLLAVCAESAAGTTPAETTAALASLAKANTAALALATERMRNRRAPGI